MPRIVSVNVGTPLEAAWAGIGRTSIDKQPVRGPVEVGLLGLAGDQVSDTRHHGGVDQAVYAYAREDLDWWAEQLGQELRDGQFGENLTTEGLDLNAAEIGSRWRIGEVLLEVTLTRTPCNDFKTWMGRSGYDARAWVRRFTAAGRPGPYLRVLVPGELRAGDDLQVVHEPGHGVTVRDMFVALNTDRSRLPDLLAIDGLAEKARRKAQDYVAT
ncbi:MOSC domain-containing protein [Nocardioides sp. TF02-7]|uniref:MOSC domain-containing protein n=1 Tax=Nocardioides sp. TF02-7 TaxID=2917724 RepID=UPI001F062F91|nr:MOSC domain-containing protein [Nocardioides sp. TF02-7]UMG92923.1 MOSC domain-containing protein [Nocardioides sp. TF02-7]